MIVVILSDSAHIGFLIAVSAFGLCDVSFLPISVVGPGATELLGNSVMWNGCVDVAGLLQNQTITGEFQLPRGKLFQSNEPRISEMSRDFHYISAASTWV